MSSFIDTILPIEQAEKIARYIEFPDWLLARVASHTYDIVGPAADSFESIIKSSRPHWHSTVSSWIEGNNHPFFKRLPFTNPWYVAFGVIMYFTSIVLFTGIGKVLGKHNYKLLGMFHNLFLYLLSVYMSVGLLVSARAAGYSLWNNAAGTSDKEWRVAKLIWVFYVSKVPEWFDTVIMVLKHNYRQVSFLHVYHHVTIFVIWWIACVMGPGGEAYYSAMVNSGIHVAMYGYYFLTMIFATGPIRSFLNNFKFVITQGQMAQFFFNCLQSAYDLLIVPRAQLKYNASLLQLLFWYMITLLALFGNFLIKNKKKPQRGMYSPTSPKSSNCKSFDSGDLNTSHHTNGNIKDGMANAQKNVLKNGNGKDSKKKSNEGRRNINTAQPIKDTPQFRSNHN